MKEERNHHFKYILKLANLPLETYAIDLTEIAICVKARAVFLPKNCYSKNYEKARYTWFYFNLDEDMKIVKRKIFI